MTPPRNSHVIRDANGAAIRWSRNLAGVRTYAGKCAAKKVDISRIGKPKDDPEGKLCILFVDGSSYETNFASFSVLRDFVRRWRNIYGASLSVDGTDCGVVTRHNLSLCDELW